MNLHLPVMPHTYGNAINEASSWKERALAAEAEQQRLQRLTVEQATRIAVLDAGVSATRIACEHLEHAAGVVDGAQVMVLQKDLAKANEQIARQETALRAYETAHHELNDGLRTLAEQRDTALATIERMSREGAWTPQGVAS